MATTGPFWNLANPEKPWGLFDPNSQLDIPFDWTDWLADKEAVYASHNIIADPVLTIVDSFETDGVITALVKVANGADYEIGVKYPVTCRVTATFDGRQLIDDRTVYLKIKER